ncbi:hypothetical protein FOA52_000979 [Chlamydomonas sp. UWO 241]|nr:hypothetical protein FOA52_000979 [Chlamydomonas sp. UWO 241]
MAEEEGDLLVLLLDAHLFDGALRDGGGSGSAHGAAGAAGGGREQAGVGTSGQLTPGELLEQVLYYVGAYCLLHDGNQLAVFVMGDRTCEPVYTLLADNEAVSAASGKLYQAVRDGVLRAVRQYQGAPAAAAAAAPTRTALSGALSRALCLIHRLTLLPGRSRSGAGHARPRVLVALGSPDTPSQYIPTMNAIFSAQRADVAVDALVLHPAGSAFMQQATHLTGGLHFHPSKSEASLQHMLQSLSADTATRAALAVQQPLGVDFRASCFCHKRAIDVGYVCCVCLSIFCRQAPSCFICGTEFTVAPGGQATGAAAAAVVGGAAAAKMPAV